MAMEKGAKQMQAGLSLLERVTEAAGQVRLTTQQQRRATGQVVETMEQLTEASRQVSATAQQIAAAAGNLADLAGNLETTAAAGQATGTDMAATVDRLEAADESAYSDRFGDPPRCRGLLVVSVPMMIVMAVLVDRHAGVVDSLTASPEQAGSSLARAFAVRARGVA